MAVGDNPPTNGVHMSHRRLRLDVTVTCITMLLFPNRHSSTYASSLLSHPTEVEFISEGNDTKTELPS